MKKKEPKKHESTRATPKAAARTGSGNRNTGKGKAATDKKHRPSNGPAVQGTAKVKEGNGEVKPKLSDKLKQKTFADTAPHLIVEARAGTGKTTTLIEGLKLIKGVFSSLIPSQQQKKIWDAMYLSEGKAKTIGFVAFNKSIATELQARVPEGCQAMTMHSMGMKAITNTFDRVKVNSFRVIDIISELMERDIRELRRTKQLAVKAIEDLVGLCKQNLVGVKEGGDIYFEDVNEELSELVSYYDVDTGYGKTEVFDIVPRVLERCKDIARDGCIDFNDMIWAPVALGLSMTKYDLLLVDEAQDLNRCQQQLALKAGKRLILIGDPKQAIYGFAGADSESMARMYDILNSMEHGCMKLPLTVTRRCGKAIVEEAKKIVPDFEAHPSNPPGKISHRTYENESTAGNQFTGTYRSFVEDGDFILCRVNAPLVSQCFKFLKAGRKAVIQGRDIGQGLLKVIDKAKANTIEELTGKLSDWHHSETQKENAKRNPSEQRLIALQDRHDCLMCFCEEAQTIQEVKGRIERIFTDDKSSPGIRLSSIHKAKGLESKRVFLLQPKGSEVQHPMSKSNWAKEQDLNLLYVAITRAIGELVYVR